MMKFKYLLILVLFTPGCKKEDVEPCPRKLHYVTPEGCRDGVEGIHPGVVREQLFPTCKDCVANLISMYESIVTNNQWLTKEEFLDYFWCSYK